MDKEKDILMDDIDERIEAFLQGRMSAEEEGAFKKELKDNPELHDRAMTMALLIKGIQANESDKEKETIASVGKSNNSKVRSILWWACSVAAVFAIFFGIYKDRRYRMLDAAVSSYYSQYDIADLSRGETDSIAISHLYSLFKLIQEKRNVSNIIKELEPVYASLDTNYTYYPYANDIMWNLAIAYVKDDKIDKAIVLLEKLKNENPDTPISTRADELIKKLKEM